MKGESFFGGVVFPRALGFAGLGFGLGVLLVLFFVGAGCFRGPGILGGGSGFFLWVL